MHTLYVTNLTFVVLLAHQEYLYSNHYWNKSLITQWVLYITNECVNKDKKVELYVVEKGKMPNSLSKIRRVSITSEPGAIFTKRKRRRKFRRRHKLHVSRVSLNNLRVNFDVTLRQPHSTCKFSRKSIFAY